MKAPWLSPNSRPSWMPISERLSRLGSGVFARNDERKSAYRQRLGAGPELLDLSLGSTDLQPPAAAIAAMVAAGQKRLLECVVVGPGPEVITPCGGCRQKLREFAGDELPVHLCGPDGLHRTVTLGQLLPMSFGPHNIGKP